ncbi:MAG TPA: hypothetical protein VK780_09160 [Thermoanaerobaculia bacterium]|nr:hypothetical protein [Thermoanaerobaculia bacterium]
MEERILDLATRAPAAAPRRGALLASASLLLAAAALISFGLEVADRSRVERFVTMAGLESGRPLDVASLRMEPAADLAAAAAVEVAIQNSDAPATGAAPWLGAARDLALGALRKRPGWPLHLHVLAQLAYREGRVAGASADPRQWMKAWRAATRGAPEWKAIRAAQAEACLEAWPTLPSASRPEALQAVRAALESPEFVAQNVEAAVERLGLDETIGLLPDRPEPMRTAAAALAHQSLDRAAQLLDRADRAERRDREAALRHLEELSRSNERAALARACRAFAREFPCERFDDSAGRLETARVLQLWPEERGNWTDDARAPLVRFLLDAPLETVSSVGLSRAVTSLSGVAEPVLAQALLLDGDEAGAEALRASAAGTTQDWAAYELRFARLALRRGEVTEAGRALDRLGPEQRNTCDAVLLRLEVAQRGDHSVEALALEQRLAELRIEAAASADWPRSGRLAVCLDPTLRERSLSVLLVATSPAIVAYGWDQSRTGTLLVTSQRDLTVPLGARTGGRTFWFAALAGGPVEPRNLAVR